ncbi:MAG: GntR family transcriptional repressor for pyruvate dehydrogenase complex [Motiliproteus sp.]|jgi:GntR family transcriptional repressor for pyruvate dehydrogenase complex
MVDSSERDEPLAQQIALALQRSMLSGDIRPGSKLASQRSMVDQYQASRASIREAMGLLQGAGLIETRHGGGSYCQNLLAPFFTGIGEESVATPQALPIQVLEMREMLEGEAAYYCALRASDAELSLLSKEYLSMSRRNKGATTLHQAKSDLSFHMRIAENCHHLLLTSISQILYSRYFNAIYYVLSQNIKKRGRYPEQIGSQHQQIYQAIMARDPEAARVAASEHIAYTRGLLLS